MNKKKSKLVLAAEKFPEVVTASLLWCLFSLPIITMGAASCALYYAVNKAIVQDRSYVMEEFWKGFRRDRDPIKTCVNDKKRQYENHRLSQEWK